MQARSVLTVDDVSPGTLAPTSTAPIATARELTGGAAGPVAGERPAHLDDEHPVLSALPARERLLATAWLAGYRSARTRDAPPLRCAAGYVRPRQARPLRAAAAVGAGAPRPMLDDIPRRRTPAGRRRGGDGATRRRARSAAGKGQADFLVGLRQ